jgi:hypothetical protein
MVHIRLSLAIASLLAVSSLRRRTGADRGERRFPEPRDDRGPAMKEKVIVAKGGIMDTQKTMLAMAAMQVAAILALAAPAQAQPATCNGRSLSNGGTIVPQNTPATVQGTVTSAQGVYYPVTASAAASYTFTFCSNGGSSNYDSWLCLYSSSGVLITQNDDSCGLSSQIVANLAAGSYYIAVSGFSSSAGSYTMAYLAPGVVPNAPPAIPASMTQAASPGGQALAAGSVAGNTVYFRATLTDTNATNMIGMQVEVLPAASPFQAGVTGTAVQTAANALVASGNVSEVSIDFTPLGDGAYHWRARAFDDQGAYSGWQEFSVGATSFYIDGTPPSAPTGPFEPSSGAKFTSPAAGQRSVTFSWGAAVDSGPPLPLSYVVEVSFSSDFTNVTNSTVTAETTYSALYGASIQNYYWRVSAVDSAGNQGPFAGPFSFKVEGEGGPEEPDKDILPCAAGVETPGWTPIVGLLIAGMLLRRRRLRA